MKKTVCERICDAILKDATDRRGWRQAWDDFDDDTQDEIKSTWLNLIRRELYRVPEDE
jgi:hypothetical protein